jgi:hypothetical protein
MITFSIFTVSILDFVGKHLIRIVRNNKLCMRINVTFKTVIPSFVTGCKNKIRFRSAQNSTLKNNLIILI